MVLFLLTVPFTFVALVQDSCGYHIQRHRIAFTIANAALLPLQDTPLQPLPPPRTSMPTNITHPSLQSLNPLPPKHTNASPTVQPPPPLLLKPTIDVL
jgi:hypothetical protein